MRISHSALQVYTECGYKYFLSYMWKLRSTSKRSALAFGDAMDVGLNTLLETREIDFALDKFKAHWLTFKDKDIKYSKSDVEEHLLDEGTDEKDKAWISLNRKGIILLQEFNAQIMPRIKEVIKIQIDQVVSNGIGDELVIKTDFICRWEDDRIILFDNKTSSVKYDDDAVKKSEQLAIYYETLKHDYNIDAAGYIVIPKALRKKKLPAVDITVLIDNVDPETIQNTLRLYDETLENIKAANFRRNKDACVGKFGKCDYYDYCSKGSTKGLEEKRSER